MKPTFYIILKRAAMTLLLALTTFTGAWAKDFITDVVLIGGSKSEVNNLKAAYQSKGWTVIDKDLNDGCGSTSDYIYLLYKTADNFENSPNLTFITGFYLTNESGHLSEDRNFNGLPYHLVPYDGGSHFKSVQGNLNSNCIPTSSDIHLYYTTAGLDNKTAICKIFFDANKNGGGVVGKNGDNSVGYDLNAGCGKLSDYIFMHCSSYKSNYWDIVTSSDFSQCRITDFNSEGKDSVKSVPAIINGALVTDIYPSVNLSTISNLETIYFTDAFEPTEMLSAKDCKKLTNIEVVDNNGTIVRSDELPNRITSIPAEAFFGSALTKIKIHTGVTSIGEKAFSNCSSLASITMDSGNSVYDSRCNCNAIIEKSSNKLIAGCKNTTIPNGVKSVGSFAFSGCTGLSSIDIPNSVTSVGSFAFSGCTGLSSIDISNSVKNVGSSAFSGCTSLSSIDIPNSVTSVGSSAFSGCTSLSSIDFPDSVTIIKESTFNGCSNLTSIIIPNILQSIESHAFEKCSSLRSVIIPNGVKQIGHDAFKGCTGMTDVHCFADPDKLKWSENGCDDFKAGRATKCHVFKVKDWNIFRNSVNVTFVEDLFIDLADNASNDAFLNIWQGRKVNVTLQGRTFFKKDQCNTLCLPFTVTDKDSIDNVTFSGTPFEGATVMKLNNTSFSNGTMTLNFKNVTTIEAGKPYIIKWPMVNNNDYYCANPTFHDVTITSTKPTAISSTNKMVTFTGTFSPVALVKDDLTKLFLGLNNVLYSPKSNMAINACRAWFQLVSPITTVGDMNGDRGINVTDVTSLVNHILGNANSNIIIANGDVNGDGGINVTDVTSLVNLILNSSDNIYNVVVNIDGNTITYNGSSNGDPRAGENHIWDE